MTFLTKSKTSNKPYLNDFRLSDVLALIQVLALSENIYRSENGLTIELQGKPKSVKDKGWSYVAQQHPEFFRVNTKQENKVSLISRHAISKNYNLKELPIEHIHKLIETAIQLHDKEVERSEKWKHLIPLYAVIFTGIITIIINLLSNNN